jgi:hypothetical protein
MNPSTFNSGRYVAFADIRAQAEGKPDALAVEREVQGMERRPCFVCDSKPSLSSGPSLPARTLDGRAPMGAPLALAPAGTPDRRTHPEGMVILESGEAIVVHKECLERLKVS